MLNEEDIDTLTHQLADRLGRKARDLVAELVGDVCAHTIARIAGDIAAATIANRGLDFRSEHARDVIASTSVMLAREITRKAGL